MNSSHGYDKFPSTGFYGRRKGRALSHYQTQLLQGAPQLSLIPKLVNHQVVRAEIGFGGGDRLIALAESEKTAMFLGCEPYINGIAKALASVKRKLLDNVYLFPSQAKEFLAVIPDSAISSLEINFPDPWAKRRHHKRRLINKEFIAQLARVIKPHGSVKFVTDSQDYAKEVLQLFTQGQDFSLAIDKGDAPSDDSFQSAYAKKARDKGTALVFFNFLRNQG